ncbi:hypothetical protein [Streptomyces niveus]|uniref:hypothetical protein n=1 Tax=Streptomyces niveus TaxID=193462 RepID=UPI00084C3A76|nr:hypothetical protein [Streptomyces niveus]
MTRRRRTTAVVLLGVAVGGVSACVAVEPPAGSGAGPGAGAVRGAPARAEVAPRITQPPAREVLEAASPPRRTPAPRRPGPAGADTVAPPPPEPPGRRTAVRPPAPPAPPVPAAPTAPPDLGAGLCALGTEYGGWAPGSPESRICEKTYGG